MDEVCEACGNETDHLEWDEEFGMYVCTDCFENPPED